MTEKQLFDLNGKRVWIAGGRGMVGSALVRRLESEPVGDLISPTSKELDLRHQRSTEEFIGRTRPHVVLLAAGRVGGIQANRTAQAQFLYDNLMIAANVVEASHKLGVEKLVNMGSSCVYPREAPQPISEDALLTGRLDKNHEGYAIAKIAALQLTKMYRRQHGLDAISLMPTNLYGPNDNFDLETSHVLPALLRKVHEAKLAGAEKVEVWGTGNARREFLHVDDLADATLFALKHYEGEEHLNVGAGKDLSIRELAHLIAEVVGWEGELVFDTSMPDGTPRRLLDVSKLTSLGWKASVGIREGIQETYKWLLGNLSEALSL